METRNLSNGRVEIWTDAAHVIRKIGDSNPTDVRRRRVSADELDQWEEVAVEDMRPYSDEQYNAKVAALVAERYPLTEENAITRKLLFKLLHPEASTLDESGTDTELPKEVAQFEAYNIYVEDCKLRAKNPELYVEAEESDGSGISDESDEREATSSEEGVGDE